MKKSFLVLFSLLIFCLISFPVYADEEGDSGISIDVPGGGLAEDIFGGSINLNIMNPSNFMGVEGTASIWSLVAYAYSFITVILFVGFIFAAAIGAIKWISSQGQEAQVQSASKWLKNAFFGFIATIGVFIIVNFITYILGLGSVFELGQNLAVCEGRVLYEYKKEMGLSGQIQEGCVWRCPEGGGGWQCMAVEPIQVPEEEQ